MMNNQNKQLTRSRTSCILGGVCGGLANYFDFDPTLVRLLFVAVALLTCSAAAIFYIVAWIIMPQEP